MNILIVDDNADNRTTLELLIEEIDDTIPLAFAADGQEAIDMCRQTHYDIIFMDIMMPNVDGIAATGAIKTFDKKAMIIAVSALEDSGSKNTMLLKGAEDYVTKPIIMDLFQQRVKNYLEIVSHRQDKPLNTKAHNLFRKDVYSHSTHFNIENDATLAEFWEYYLNSADKNILSLSDGIRLIYAIVKYSLKKKKTSTIIAEENKEYLFITIDPFDSLKESTLTRVMLKHYPNGRFIYSANKLSFMLDKNIQSQKDAIDIDDYSKAILSKSHDLKTSAAEYAESTVTDVIDKIEMLETIENTLLDWLFKLEDEHNIKYFKELSSLLEEYAETISLLIEFEHLAHAIRSLSSFLSTITDDQINEKNSKSLLTLLRHFFDDISMWRDNVFIKREANDIHYLDASLLSSCLHIESTFTEQPLEEEEEFELELF